MSIIIAGRYEVEGEMGRGATGVVFRARELANGRIVALKQLAVADRTWLQRFQREAQTARSLSHPNILSVYELLADTGRFYLVMELVEGSTLEAILNAGKRYTFPDALLLLEQTASALDHAHEKSIIHRDVKPGNLLVRRDGVVKLVDFGVAKGLDSSASSTSTMVGLAVGTPEYMSPEQIDLLPLDPRSDQFSLAAVAYQLLTGIKPFAAESMHALMAQIVTEPPPTLDEARQVLGPPADVLARGLAKRPGDRFPTCLAFVQALKTAAPAPAATTTETGGGLFGRLKRGFFR